MDPKELASRALSARALSARALSARALSLTGRETSGVKDESGIRPTFDQVVGAAFAA